MPHLNNLILTLLLIAMKSYLFILLLFLGTLCLPIFIFSQEHFSQQHSGTSEQSFPPSSSDEHLNPTDRGELSGTWPDHMTHETDNFQTKFFNMLLLLGLLIGFMILASWALKRMMKTKMTQLNTASDIKLLETRYLSPRATLYLIQVQNQSLLIAESPTHVTYLTTLPQEEIHK